MIGVWTRLLWFCSPAHYTTRTPPSSSGLSGISWSWVIKLVTMCIIPLDAMKSQLTSTKPECMHEHRTWTSVYCSYKKKGYTEWSFEDHPSESRLFCHKTCQPQSLLAKSSLNNISCSVFKARFHTNKDCIVAIFYKSMCVDSMDSLDSLSPSILIKHCSW